MIRATGFAGSQVSIRMKPVPAGRAFFVDSAQATAFPAFEREPRGRDHEDRNHGPKHPNPFGQPSLEDLMVRFLAARSDAAAAAVEPSEGEVEPHEVAAGFRVDPRAAWTDATTYDHNRPGPTSPRLCLPRQPAHRRFRGPVRGREFSAARSRSATAAEQVQARRASPDRRAGAAARPVGTRGAGSRRTPRHSRFSPAVSRA